MKKVVSICLNIVLVILIILLGLKFSGVLSFHYVSGDSMYPNYNSGDYIITLNVATPVRGDVVVATAPDGTQVIKRIIALPGETVEIINGKIYIDGVYLKEDYLDSVISNTNTENMNAITLGEDEYFICGDNRLNSLDSRTYGPLSVSNILGVVVLHLAF